MYTRVAQADVTTVAVNVIIMSNTTLYNLVLITLMVVSHLFLVNMHKLATV